MTVKNKKGISIRSREKQRRDFWEEEEDRVQRD